MRSLQKYVFFTYDFIIILKIFDIILAPLSQDAMYCLRCAHSKGVCSMFVHFVYVLRINVFFKKIYYIFIIGAERRLKIDQ